MVDATRKDILLIEDVPSQAETYAGFLRIAGYNIATATTAREALALLDGATFDAIVADLHLPDMEGTGILKLIRQKDATTPIVVITADGSTEAAMIALKEGAYDFILKPFPAPRLIVTLHNALENNEMTKEVSAWRQTFSQSRFHGFVGYSAPMQAVYKIIDSVAASKACVLITGESGTGKELAAKALHQASPRREQPFIAINCGAIPYHLLESHIFGHVKGAFTGAVADAPGAAKQADGGTLFLDEIGELPMDLQVKLLRFLQTNEISPVGSSKSEQLDLRIVAATNRNPLAEVKAGRFREDLYYRLHVVPLEMPVLRDRGDDIQMLAMHFIEKYNQQENKNFRSVTEGVLAAFRRYEWPGNVRQLENTIQQTIVLHNGPVLEESMLPEEFAVFVKEILTSAKQTVSVPDSDAPATRRQIEPLWKVEKQAILTALDATGQDVVKAAALLDVSPSTLYRKLQAWKIDKT